MQSAAVKVSYASRESTTADDPYRPHSKQPEQNVVSSNVVGPYRKKNPNSSVVDESSSSVSSDVVGPYLRKNHNSSVVDESLSLSSSVSFDVVGPYLRKNPNSGVVDKSLSSSSSVSSDVVGPYRRNHNSGVVDEPLSSSGSAVMTDIKRSSSVRKRKHPSSSSSSSKLNTADSSSNTEKLHSTTVKVEEDASDLGKNECKLIFANGANVSIVIAETNNNNNEGQTRIHLLVDRSGSMGLSNSGDNQEVPRIEIEKRVVKRMIQAQNPEKLKVNCYELQPGVPLIDYKSIHSNGSCDTNVSECVWNFINSSGHLQRNKKDVIIVMTDDKNDDEEFQKKPAIRNVEIKRSAEEKEGEGNLYCVPVAFAGFTAHNVSFDPNAVDVSSKQQTVNSAYKKRSGRKGGGGNNFNHSTAPGNTALWTDALGPSPNAPFVPTRTLSDEYAEKMGALNAEATAKAIVEYARVCTQSKIKTTMSNKSEKRVFLRFGNHAVVIPAGRSVEVGFSVTDVFKNNNKVLYYIYPNNR